MITILITSKINSRYKHLWRCQLPCIMYSHTKTQTSTNCNNSLAFANFDLNFLKWRVFWQLTAMADVRVGARSVVDWLRSVFAARAFFFFQNRPVSRLSGQSGVLRHSDASGFGNRLRPVGFFHCPNRTVRVRSHATTGLKFTNIVAETTVYAFPTLYWNWILQESHSNYQYPINTNKATSIHIVPLSTSASYRPLLPR